MATNRFSFGYRYYHFIGCSFWNNYLEVKKKKINHLKFDIYSEGRFSNCNELYQIRRSS